MMPKKVYHIRILVWHNISPMSNGFHSLLLNAHRYFRDNEGFIPYVGAYAGMYRINHRIAIGVFEVNEDNWHFGLAPEIGFAIPVQYDVYATVVLRFNYAFEAGLTPNQSFFGIKVGLVYF